jgi:hypothetical protein
LLASIQLYYRNIEFERLADLRSQVFWYFLGIARLLKFFHRLVAPLTLKEQNEKKEERLKF